MPVLEGTESGLRALRHLFDQPVPVAPRPPVVANEARRAVWRGRLVAGDLDARTSLELLRDYDITVTRSTPASTAEEARDAAGTLGFPVVLKTDAPVSSTAATSTAYASGCSTMQLCRGL